MEKPKISQESGYGSQTIKVIAPPHTGRRQKHQQLVFKYTNASKENDEEKDKSVKKKSYWLSQAFSSHWLLTLLMVLVGVDICCHISETVIESEHIVLTFIGIMATFMVVSNYMQVKDVKEESSRKIEKMRMELDVMSNEISKKADAYLYVDAIPPLPSEGGEVDVVVHSNTRWEVAVDQTS